METEEQTGAPKAVLLTLALVMVVVGAALAGIFIFRLQPAIVNTVATQAGVGSIIMPSNAATVNFFPINATVVMGTNNTVIWTNDDTVPHTVVVCPAGGGSLCPQSSAIAVSATLLHGDAFQVIFNATGTYHYYCSIHPNVMRATIVVVNGPSSTTA